MLSAYLDNELTGKDEEYLKEHIKSCQVCSRELEYLKQTKKLFLYGGKPGPAPFFETRLFERIGSVKAPDFSMPRLAWRLAPVFFALFIVTGGLFVRKIVVNKPAEETLPAELLFASEVEEEFSNEIIKICHGYTESE